MKSIQAKEIKDKHILVDVRTPGEHRGEKIPNSLNMPLDELAGQVRSLENHSDIVLVCASGTRAKKAREILSKENISACVLEDGIRGWKEAGLPTDEGHIYRASSAHRCGLYGRCWRYPGPPRQSLLGPAVDFRGLWAGLRRCHRYLRYGSPFSQVTI